MKKIVIQYIAKDKTNAKALQEVLGQNGIEVNLKGRVITRNMTPDYGHMLKYIKSREILIVKERLHQQALLKDSTNPVIMETRQLLTDNLFDQLEQLEQV